MTDQPLWSPSKTQIENSNLSDFINYVSDREGRGFDSYETLHHWSVEQSENFWDAVWDYCGVIGDKGASPYLINETDMLEAQFFPQAKLNYAQNILRRQDEETALIFRAEHKKQEFQLTWKELNEQVSRFQQAFKQQGLKKGDRVCALLPNMIETVVLCLAVTSLGGVWSSASPDFGEEAVLDRFGQLSPKYFIGVDGYFYNGKIVDCMANNKAILARIPSVEKALLVSYAGSADQDLSVFTHYSDFIKEMEPQDLIFEPVKFNHPLFIMFSSGTTGKPKCIIHGTGGTILQHLKEHKLHSDVRRNDRVFYFTTTGWMMWNWLMGGLMAEATLLLYDGSPFAPITSLLDYVEDHKATFFGASAKYIDMLKKRKIQPCKTYDFSDLRTIASTGSPLVVESFEYIYENIKKDIHLASISGGTDIVSCFLLGNPMGDVHAGELQVPGLGMAIEVWDDQGKPVQSTSGELVCAKPFPCQPVGFFNDDEAKSRYKSAYFEDYSNVWCHGDWVERTQHNGYIIHGRSDATLNPGGVRIGTAEIYRQVEQVDAVIEAIAVGQEWKEDVRVVLFVVLREGVILDQDLKNTIKQQIKTGATPRHVPTKILQVLDIPRTKSGKITELAVKNIIHGRSVKNKGALANPEVLNYFEDLKELQN